MMEARHDFQLRLRCLAMGLIMSAIYISSQAENLAGFLSIDCGDNSTYNDNVTTLTWEGDGNYTLTGTNGEVPFQVNLSYNSEALQTFRYFPEHRSKHCYELRTTTVNISYNLRAMFLHGGSSELNLPIKFAVSVNDTVWATPEFQTDDDLLYTLKILDGIFFSPGYLTHFCLVPQTGVPFISSLELRQLDPDGIMYSINEDNSWYLSTVFRWNCGPQGISPDIVRYPGDPFDRLWHTPTAIANATPTTDAATNTTSSSVNNVPQIVMHDAWLNDEPNTSFGLNFTDGVENSYVAVYVEEIEPNASSAGVRSFDVSLNGNSKNVTAGSNAFLVKYENFPLLDHNFLTFTASPDSTLGPIVNAIEVYFQREFSTAATAAQDESYFKILPATYHGCCNALLSPNPA